MPAYEYQCQNCKKTSVVFKSMSKLEKFEYCSACGTRKPMTRLLAAPPAHVHLGTPRFHKPPAA